MPIGAPDVVVYCDSTLVPAMQAVGCAFRARTGAPIRVFAGPGPQLLGLIAHGARNDVLVTQANWMRQGAARHLVKPATLVGIGTDATVLAGRHAPSLPALPSETALPALLGGARLAVIDPTQPDGPDGVALACRLGWRVKLAGEIDGPGVAFLLTHGRAALGLLPRSATLAEPELGIAATVPDAVSPPVVYAAAASKNVLSDRTGEFLAYLAGPDAKKILNEAGLAAA